MWDKPIGRLMKLWTTSRVSLDYQWYNGDKVPTRRREADSGECAFKWQKRPLFCFEACTRPEVKTSLNVLVTVHVTFDCGCLTRQKLVFLYHMDIADRFSPKKWGVLDFRSENAISRSQTRTVPYINKQNKRRAQLCIIMSWSEHW